MIGIIIYFAVLIGIGVFDFFRSKNFDQYVVADRKQNTLSVTFSLLATIIGGSATIGLIERAYTIGFPAFWWLGVGAIGLLLQGLFLTRKVKEMNAYTLPDVADKTIGKPSRIMISIIIVLAWMGIIAAQYNAAATMINVLLPDVNPISVKILVAAIIMIYASLGGQLSILNTDFFQFAILSFAIVFTFGHLFSGNVPQIENPLGEVVSHFGGLLNNDFKIGALLSMLFLVGGSYFIGPDMFSRVFTAKSTKTASQSVFISAAILAIISLLITFIGLWARAYLTVPEGSTLMQEILNRLPEWSQYILIFGLLSAIVSSADTMLVTTATIIENDILEKKNVWVTRGFVLAVGVISLIIALTESNIITLLFASFSIYTPAIVLPLLIGILFYRKRECRKWWMFAAVVTGGILGAVGVKTGIEWFKLVGMGLSGGIGILSFTLQAKSVPN